MDSTTTTQLLPSYHINGQHSYSTTPTIQQHQWKHCYNTTPTIQPYQWTALLHQNLQHPAISVDSNTTAQPPPSGHIRGQCYDSTTPRIRPCQWTALLLQHNLHHPAISVDSTTTTQPPPLVISVDSTITAQLTPSGHIIGHDCYWTTPPLGSSFLSTKVCLSLHDPVINQ